MSSSGAVILAVAGAIMAELLWSDVESLTLGRKMKVLPRVGRVCLITALCVVPLWSVLTRSDVDVSIAVCWAVLSTATVVGFCDVRRCIGAPVAKWVALSRLGLLCFAAVPVVVWAFAGGVDISRIPRGREAQPWMQEALWESQRFTRRSFRDGWMAASWGDGVASDRAYSDAIDHITREEALVYLHRGEVRYCSERFDDAMDDFVEAGRRLPDSSLIAARGYACLCRLGEKREAQSLFLGLMDSATSRGDTRMSNIVRVVTCADTGQLLLARVKELGLYEQARSTYCIAERLLAEGKPDEALPFIRLGLELSREPETTLARWRTAL